MRSMLPKSMKIVRNFSIIYFYAKYVTKKYENCKLMAVVNKVTIITDLVRNLLQLI